jgi:signal transduction histidine kinase
MDNTLADDIAAISQIDAVEQILEVICRTTGLGFSAVARVTDKRWVACAVRDEISFGLVPGGELELESTLCHEIRSSNQLIAIDHVAEDERFHNHHTPLRYGFQSYISVPINLPDGQFFGTLCAIDPSPARVNTPEVIGMFTLFSDLIAMHLDAQQKMADNEAALLSERETAKLREQFIAVLGHDLRNPLGAINAGAQLLGMMPQSDDALMVLGTIRRSAARMEEMIDNVLDLARGRLGGGLVVRCEPAPQLEGELGHAITELQTAWPHRSIHREFALQEIVSCDSARLAQMLSNLVGNALTHGDADTPIWVRAESSADGFKLSVTNLGPTIEPRVIERFFEPFARGESNGDKQGLGLGLYIAAEIARAHEGTLKIASSGGETRFTFWMPLAPAGT